MMTERKVWLTAAAIVQAHGEDAAQAVLKSLGDVLLKPHGGENWRRVAMAVDAIVDARAGS